MPMKHFSMSYKIILYVIYNKTENISIGVHRKCEKLNNYISIKLKGYFLEIGMVGNNF